MLSQFCSQFNQACYTCSAHSPIWHGYQHAHVRFMHNKMQCAYTEPIMDQTNTLMETDPEINAPVQNKKRFESLYLKYSTLAAMKNCPQSMPKSPI